METIKLDLVPGKKMPSLHASQFDDGREHGIDLFENGVVYKLDGTETLTINERKGDNCICSLDIENTFADSNHIVFASTEQMCAVWGNNICELVITKGEKTIGTLNFILEIEPSPTENGIESESEISNLERQIEEITEQVIGDNYYTAEETDDAIATAIEGKADTTYVDEELAKKADKSDTYTKTEVDTLIDNLPEPMIFKGTLGVGGTIQTLPTASASNEGYTYKVITDGTYAGQTAKVGDVFTSNGSAWVLMPSGDTDTDTWRNIKVNGTEVLGNGISSGAVDFEDTANVKFEFDANGNKVRAKLDGIYTKSEVDDLLDDKADADNTYTKEQVDDIVYNILPDDTASGGVANFNTSLVLPIKSVEIDVNAVQESGTPTPATPLPISGWSEISLTNCGANLVDVKPYNDWVFTNAYALLPFSVPNKQVVVSLLDNDVSIDISGVNFGFVDSNYDRQSALTNRQYRWSVSNGVVQNNKTNISISGNNILTGLIIYPKTEEAYNKILQRFKIVIALNFASIYEPYNGNAEVINLGGTYYGGVLHIDKNGHRTFEATHEYETDMGQYNYIYVSASNCFRTTNFNKAYKRTAYTIIANSLCSHYGGAKLQEVLNQSANNFTYAFGIVGLYNGSVLFRDTNYSDATAFKSSMQGVSMTFELETPIFIDLSDGEPIITLIGTNNIYADTGDSAVVFKCSVSDYVSAHSGGNLLGMGGVYLGGAKSGGGEEEPDEGEDTEKVKLDETKVEIKTIVDTKKLGGE